MPDTFVDKISTNCKALWAKIPPRAQTWIHSCVEAALGGTLASVVPYFVSGGKISWKGLTGLALLGATNGVRTFFRNSPFQPLQQSQSSPPPTSK